LGRNGFIKSALAAGCVWLTKLYIFECPFHPTDVARLVVHLPKLTDLGCNETGKVLKHIEKKSQVSVFVVLLINSSY
jgi:hypothetical protein